jgi:hypothetical protein
VARRVNEPGKGSFWRIDSNSESKTLHQAFNKKPIRSPQSPTATSATTSTATSSNISTFYSSSSNSPALEQNGINGNSTNCSATSSSNSDLENIGNRVLPNYLLTTPINGNNEHNNDLIKFIYQLSAFVNQFPSQIPINQEEISLKEDAHQEIENESTSAKADTDNCKDTNLNGNRKRSIAQVLNEKQIQTSDTAKILKS